MQHGVAVGFAGLTETRSYNKRLQPSILSASTTANTVLSFSYNFDLGVANNGNVKQVINNINNARTQIFTYDELNRLKTAQSQATSGSFCWGQRFVYDIWANLLQINALKCAMNYLALTIDNQNRMVGAPYDAAGNALWNGTVYDAEGRLTSVAGQNFIYDAEGQRVMKDQVGANTWDKMYWHGLNGEVLMESDFSGGNQVEHIYFNGQRIAKREPNGTVYYFFDDHLGNTRVTTNSSGAVMDEFDPYPHGWFRTISFTSGDWYLYTDHEYDPDTALHYMRARHYSPSAGRFLQPDPLYVELRRLSDPQQLNIYTYARNNPLKFVDPLGLDIAVTGSDPEEYRKRLQANLSYQIALNKNKVVIVGAKGKELGKKELKALGKSLSGAEKELFKAITDTNNHVTINTTRNDSSTDFGKFEGSGRNTIDFGDLGHLSGPQNAGGLSAEQVVAHETLEAYASSQGADFGAAHGYANGFFGGLGVPTSSRFSIDFQQMTATAITFTSPVHGSAGTSLRFTKQFVTPIPIPSLRTPPSSPPPGHIVSAEKVP